MGTSSVPITPGTGAKSLATFSITEDAITKEIARSVISNSAGTELGTSTNPLGVTEQTLLAGEDLTNNVTKVEERYTPGAVVATGTTTVKSGAGFLHCLTINNPSALASASTVTTIVIYDNTAASGTKLATISLPVSASIASMPPINIFLDDTFVTGLTFSITLGTSGVWTPDITVSYR